MRRISGPIAKPAAAACASRSPASKPTAGVAFTVRRHDRDRDVSLRPRAAERRGVTAGFLFDVPVRFDTDYLEVDLSAFAAGAIPKIPLVEIKP